jgi:hypothetical protein
MGWSAVGALPVLMKCVPFQRVISMIYTFLAMLGEKWGE